MSENVGNLRDRSRAAKSLLSVLAPGPAFSECSSEQTAPPSTARYVLNGAQVYDKNADLTWQRCSVGQRWEEAAGCVGVAKESTQAQANAGLTNGWRMPTVDELKTLAANSCKNPAIDQEIFPDPLSRWYHTSDKEGSSCRLVYFFTGRASSKRHPLPTGATSPRCKSGVAQALLT